MKKLVIYPEERSGICSEIFLYREPRALHGIVYVALSLVAVVLGFLVFGRMDEVIRSEGIVRPDMNVSYVKNIISGEIESLFYKPGDYVLAGQKLFAIKGEAFSAQHKALSAQRTENLQKIEGLNEMISCYESDKDVFCGNNPTCRARYEAFTAEKNLLAAKIKRAGYLYSQELLIPESATTRSEIESLKYQLDVAVLEKEEFCTSFISSIRQELDSLRLEKENIDQQLKQLQVSLENLVIVSPIDGFVQEISSLNPGDYIFTDQKVLNIVPKADDSCRIELNIPAEKMGRLKTGQKVKLRFPAFPYYEYRGINGTLKVIQPDSQVSDSGTLFFKAYADVDSMELRSRKGESYQIKPGFEVNARIVLDNQRLMTFLLKKLDFTV